MAGQPQPSLPLPHVESVPAALLAAVDLVARERFGPSDLRGAALARAVHDVSTAYTRDRAQLHALAGDRAALCARLRFFVARDAPKIAAPLAELAAAGALPRAATLRVLDLGAGLGTTSLGAARFLLAQPGIERLHVDAVDQDAAALALADALALQYAQEAGLALTFSTRTADLTPALIDKLAPPYQLIVLGFVLNELAEAGGEADPSEQHARWLTRLSTLLSDDGVIVVLEPALREQSRNLQRTRARLLEQGGAPYLFAPCLHAGACPLLERERDWCHERLPQALPEPIAAIAREAGLRDEELSYSYLTLHHAPRTLSELDPSATDRLYRIVSAPLRSKGKLELALCGAGGATRARLLDRHVSDANAPLQESNRGTVVRFDGPGLEPGTAVRVTAETRVQRLG